MNARGLALKVAAVTAVAAIGVAGAASPASAAPDQFCANMAQASDLGARTMQEATTYDMWSAGYTLWLTAEKWIGRFC